ncbi:hypothetical protein, variant [Cryptococcus amylolentus CBS 6039]|uniref:Tubby C-terminal domain-containing protein n=2 Tax=Cryptococcus amylolentus TaxID=104669 RepID=A0A1E3I0Z1_9TREE|nr:hypothetical protein L202_02552 [Cryptococcus amylolentus CBS 6039]XP_018996589.1 hypothetical protein, variant [Cryptococcus amylolentus CBS 6039]ODN82269.1 hypothetical protein L202_02552 [Cryptococcus amylolentus CBS 6039]ODN82270.1 hypothetical protein, variant [Cryptococcus amylolentus CBS 6039]ODO09654.1 hypothetical protein I350_01867 [Cryptococcus amylolentus CBS 6273]
MNTSSTIDKVGPIGVFPAYFTSQETTLIILGKNGWSSASFTVQDEQGKLLMTGHPGKSKFWGRKYEIMVTDANGKQLFDIHRHVKLSKKVCTVLNEGQEIMEVHQKNIMSFKRRMTGTFTNAESGVSHTLALDGDWKGKNFKVNLEDGEEVATVKRSYMKNWGNHYALTVAENVDLALMSALGICIVASIMEDEMAAAVA